MIASEPAGSQLHQATVEGEFPDASPPGPADGPGAAAFDLEISITGQQPVDAALAPLSELGAHPTAAHVAIYERVHADLHEVLSELDRAQP